MESRDPLPRRRPGGYETLILATNRITEPEVVNDPDGNAIELVPPGRGDVNQLEVRLGVSDVSLFEQFYTKAAEGTAIGGNRYRVGETVFAIGNPHDLGWSHTQGVISQFRIKTYEARRVRVIQTQASINPGNSGGGLYDQEGYCLGINTWTADKSISEGIGFAVALDTLLDLEPPALAAPAEKTAKVAAPGPPEKAVGHNK